MELLSYLLSNPFLRWFLIKLSRLVLDLLCSLSSWNCKPGKTVSLICRYQFSPCIIFKIWSNSRQQAWWLVSLPTDLSYQHLFKTSFHFFHFCFKVVELRCMPHAWTSDFPYHQSNFEMIFKKPSLKAVYVCVCAHANALGGRIGVSDPLGLQVVCVSGTKLSSFARVTYTFTYWAISPPHPHPSHFERSLSL